MLARWHVVFRDNTPVALVAFATHWRPEGVRVVIERRYGKGHRAVSVGVQSHRPTEQQILAVLLHRCDGGARRANASSLGWEYGSADRGRTDGSWGG